MPCRRRRRVPGRRGRGRPSTAAVVTGTPAAGSGATLTTNSGSRPRRRSSTEPGASSQVISWAAAASASSSARRIAASSGADQPLGEGPGLLAAGVGGGLELAVDLVDEGAQVHACHFGTTVVPCQHHRRATWGCPPRPVRCRVDVSRSHEPCREAERLRERGFVDERRAGKPGRRSAPASGGPVPTPPPPSPTRSTARRGGPGYDRTAARSPARRRGRARQRGLHRPAADHPGGAPARPAHRRRDGGAAHRHRPRRRGRRRSWPGAPDRGRACCSEPEKCPLRGLPQNIRRKGQLPLVSPARSWGPDPG